MNDIAPIWLNIGSKDTELEGYTPVDRQFGQEAYPLDYADGTVDIIRASHILEHFPYEQWLDVLQDWYRALKPGGIIKIAVPDFAALAKAYVNDEMLNYQGFIMGGHTDPNDYHGGIQDKAGLTDLFMKCGIERIQEWETEINDCASYPWSLNLMGFKPYSDVERLENVGAVLACPRLGFTQHFRSLNELARCGAAVQIIQGCFWWEQLSEGMETHLETGKEYVLTVDYDSVFTVADVLELYRIMRARPDIDAVCAMQSKRGDAKVLFAMEGIEGGDRKSFLGYTTAEVSTGHFGLTLFRSSSLHSQERPWMEAQPNKDGRWADGNTHVDIDFWNRWRAAGKNLHMACSVPIGHMESMIAWPGKQLAPIHQYAQDYNESGIPKEVWS